MTVSDFPKRTLRVGGGGPPVDVTDQQDREPQKVGATMLVVCIDHYRGPGDLTIHQPTQLLGNGHIAGDQVAIAVVLRSIADSIDPTPKIQVAREIPPNGRL